MIGNRFVWLQQFDRRRAALIMAVLIVLVFLGFLVERFWFGRTLGAGDDGERGIFPVALSSVSVRDGSFGVSESGQIVSGAENASFDVDTGARFVNDLRVEMSSGVSLPVTVSYVDPKTGETVTVSDELQKWMQKNGEEFTDPLTFHIGAVPGRLSVMTAQPGTAISAITIDDTYRFNPFRFLFIVGTFGLAVFLVSYRKLIGERPEIGFLAVAMVCGSVLILTGPTNSYTWDEKIHYVHAEKMSFELRKIPVRPETSPFTFLLAERTAIGRFVNAGYHLPKKDRHNDKFFYTQVGYIPSVIGLSVGEAVPWLPHTSVFLFGRWMNLLFYSVIVLFAIRRLRSGKMILALVALLPTALFLGSNYDYDGWTIACSMLGLAYVFGALQRPEERVTWKEVTIMIGAFVLGLGSKTIYFPLMSLLFLIGPSKFPDRKSYANYLIACVLGIALVAGSFWLPLLLQGTPDGNSRAGAGKELVNASQQIRFILSDPIAYSKILLGFMGRYLGLESSRGFVTFLAYLGSIGGYFWILSAVAVATIFDKSEYDRPTSTMLVKAVTIAAYLATVALICTGLYVTFTPVRSTDILGVQPRYLLPLTFPLLFVIGSGRVKNPVNRGLFNVVLFGVMAAVFLNGIWGLVVSQYH